MKVTGSLTFHVIFSPGTVQLLRLAVASLLCKSTCRFRLVSNGCSEKENRILQEWCGGHPQLEFLISSPAARLPHGELLTRLQREEQDPVFAFMDSDIFASGDFLQELLPCLQSCDAIFSCPAMWSTREMQRMPPGFREMDGGFNEFADGTCLGNFYFAAYDNVVLTKCLLENEITMCHYSWNQIPPAVQEELRRSNQAVDAYDAGKLINILLGLRGFRCRFTPLDSLCHIGGLMAMTSRTKYMAFKSGLIMTMPLVLLKMLRWVRLYHGRFDQLGRQERRFYRALGARRNPVCAHSIAYLEHLAMGTRKPSPFHHQDLQLVARVRAFEQLLDQLHEHFGDDRLGVCPQFTVHGSDHSL